MRIWIDGGSRGNPGPSAVAFVAKTDEQVWCRAHYIGDGYTNNEAEYYALISALDFVARRAATIYTDSRLVEQQMNNQWAVRNTRLHELHQVAQGLRGDRVTIVHVPREENKAADKLVNVVLDERPEHSA